MKQVITLTISLLLSIIYLNGQTNTQEYASELAEAGKLEEAVKVIDQVIASNPPMASYYHDKTNYLLELQEYESAINTLSNAIKIMPDTTSFYDMRGIIFEAFRMYDKAINDYTTGLEVATDNKIKITSFVQPRWYESDDQRL